VGIHVPSKKCFDLQQLQDIALTGAGRRVLAKTHLRIYTSADYVQRWNEHFGWSGDLPTAEKERAHSTIVLAAEMKRKGISQRALAIGIGADPSFVSKIFNGKRPWPSRLLEKAQAWSDYCSRSINPKPPRNGKPRTTA